MLWNYWVYNLKNAVFVDFYRLGRRIPPFSDSLHFVVKSPLTSLITAVCIETAFIVSHCKNSITIATRGGKLLLFSCKSPHNRSERGCLYGIWWKAFQSHQNAYIFSGFFISMLWWAIMRLQGLSWMIAEIPMLFDQKGLFFDYEKSRSRIGIAWFSNALLVVIPL